jgi:hypothetical protein
VAFDIPRRRPWVSAVWHSRESAIDVTCWTRAERRRCLASWSVDCRPREDYADICPEDGSIVCLR